MSELRRWLPLIAPPPGGELRLRRALRSTSPRPASRRIYAVTAGAVAMAMLVVLVLPSTVTPERQIQAALHTALTAPAPDLVVRDGALLRLPSNDPRVRIYLVANSPSALPSR